MTELPPPPQDIGAESQLLGAVLIANGVYAKIRPLISDDDWYRPAHALIWAAMGALEGRGEAIDAITVAAELVNTGGIDRAGGHGYLHTLMAGVVTPGNAAHHAALVAGCAVRRRFIESLSGMIQTCYESGDSMERLLVGAQAQLDVVAGMQGGDDIPGLDTWGAFIAHHSGRPHNWVVPGMIGRKDVWLVIAPPGAGKSTMSRQLTWAIAAGIHPFRPDVRITARRTLVIDLENDEGMTADESLDHFARFDSLGDGVDDRGMIWAHPQGLNVLDPKDAYLLDQVISHAKPDFVALGSLNNAYVRKGDWDQAAAGVREVFNRLRVKHQCAFWIEGHMPKGSDGNRRHTPFGSQLFESWPSHGRVLERASDDPRAPFRFTADFRGDRGRREMPVGFVRGGQFPWLPIWTQDELDGLMGDLQ